MVIHDMRIGIIWNGISGEEYQLAKNVHDLEAYKEKFTAINTLHLSTPSITETFAAILRFAQSHDLDFCLLSHRDTWAVSPEKLKALLGSEGVGKAAIALRAGKIYAKAGVFSPKAPYIDPDFVIVNIRRCVEFDIPKRIETLPSFSHFTDAGGVQADLLAFLEAIVPYGGIQVYDDGSGLRDLYGRMRTRGFAPTPYLVDTERGFVSGDPVRDPRVHALRAELLHARGLDMTPLLAEYIKAHAVHRRTMHHIYDIPFLREPLTARLTSQAGHILKGMIRKVNFEIHKKYADRT